MTPYEYFLYNLDDRPLSLKDGSNHWDKKTLLSAIESISLKLNSLSLKKGDRIGVCLGKSVYQVAALLAIWKNDLVYVPISHKNPRDRVEYIVSNCELSLVLVSENESHQFESAPVMLIGPSSLDLKLSLSKAKISLQKSSYIIYTSGTTGQPKGVVIENTALENFFLAIQAEKFPVKFGEEVILQLVDFSFDVSFWDLGLWFLYGGTLVITDFMGNAIHLIKTILDSKVTVLTAAAPTYAIMLANHDVLKRFDLTSLRLLITTASYCPPKLASDILRSFEWATLYNCYGPTEATIYCTWTQVKKEDIDLARPLSIGHLLYQMKAAFLKEGVITPFDEMPEEAEAELLLAGPQLFSYYWQAEELTAIKTFTHAGVRYYKTGDLATRLGNQLYYYGRTDDTIKVNGNRVNLGEIEMAAGEVLPVSHNIVIDKQNDKFQTELFLFYTLRPGTIQSSEAEALMKQIFTKKLPSYMHPKKFIFLPEFPVSIAGKIDKKALRERLRSEIN